MSAVMEVVVGDGLIPESIQPPGPRAHPTTRVSRDGVFVDQRRGRPTSSMSFTKLPLSLTLPLHLVVAKITLSVAQHPHL